MTDGNEMKRQKAISRYRQKAVCRDLNLYSIRRFLDDMEEATADVAYATQDEEVFVEVLGEDEAFSFRMAFPRWKLTRSASARTWKSTGFRMTSTTSCAD